MKNLASAGIGVGGGVELALRMGRGRPRRALVPARRRVGGRRDLALEVGYCHQGLASDFKRFVLRGNVVDLAVAVVVGVAFAAVVAAFVEDLLTPLIAAIIGKPDFSALTFTVRGSVFRYGAFLNALVSFVLILAAVFFFVVAPLNALMARSGREPSTRKCIECLSEIPVEARRCAFCTSIVPSA